MMANQDRESQKTRCLIRISSELHYIIITYNTSDDVLTTSTILNQLYCFVDKNLLITVFIVFDVIKN